jgi:hypothetical protein
MHSKISKELEVANAQKKVNFRSKLYDNAGYVKLYSSGNQFC